MANMTSISGLAVKQAAIQDDPTADSGGNDHRNKTVVSLGRTAPTLGESKCLCITITEHWQSSQINKSLTQWKVSPPKQIERRDALDVAGNWPGGTHPDDKWLASMMIGGTVNLL